MTSTRIGSRAWLDGILQAFDELTGGSSDERILSFIRRIDARYRINYDLDLDEQLPIEVFHRLVEKAESVVVSAASPELLTALSALPNETWGKSELVKALRWQLIDELERVLTSTPANIEARFARGQLLLDSYHFDAAAEEFAEVVRHDADHWEARHGEIRALVKERHDVEALARLDELLDLRPDDPLGLYERAKLVMRYDYVQEAVHDIDRLIRVTDDRDALLFAAEQLLFVGRADDAAALCRRVPASLESLLLLGRALLDAGETTAAAAALEGVLALARGQEPFQHHSVIKANALRLLGDLHVRSGEITRALERYAEAMALDWPGYDLKRAVLKLAWDQQIANESRSPEADEAHWIERNMTAEFVDGKPVAVWSTYLELAPYLERLPWVDVVERLNLQPGPRDHREAFAELFRLQLPALRDLDISAEYFGFPCLFRLVAAPFFGRLERLVLRQCDLGPPSLQLLAEQVPRGLRELEVLSANARPELPRATVLADQLRRWDLPSLELLDLNSCSLNADEVIALTEARLPKLAELGLAGNDLREIDIARFFDSSLVKQLHTLNIAGTDAEPQLLLGLLDRLDGLALRRVCAHRSWSQDERRAVLNHPAYRRLEHVDFGESVISEDAWLALLD